MANADAPAGFTPVGGLDSSPYNGGMIECAILAADATATFIGDAVKLSGTADADGAPSVAQCAASDRVFGVVAGFAADPDNLSNQYRLASTLRKCYVVPALDNLFMVQADGAFAITDVGQMADFVVGTGDTTTGLSAMELNSTDIGTGIGLHILGVYRSPDNEIGTNANVIVRFNESQFRGTGLAV